MNTTFHVPRELADELVREGLGEIRPPGRVQVGGTTMMDVGSASVGALLLLGTAADVIAVTGIDPPLRLLAQKFLGWLRDAPPERPYALLAITPSGQVRIDLDQPPSEEAVVALLRTVLPDAPE